MRKGRPKKKWNNENPEQQKLTNIRKQEKDVMQSMILAKSSPPLQRLPWIHQIVHFIKIKIENLNQSSGQSDEN